MDAIDEKFNEVGPMGIFQKLLLLVLSFFTIFSVAIQDMSMFSMRNITHRCEYPKSAYKWINNLTENEKENLFLIRNKSAKAGFESCFIKDRNYSMMTLKDVNKIFERNLTDNYYTTKVKCPNGYKFFTKHLMSTVQMTFGIVCDNEYLEDYDLYITHGSIGIGSLLMGFVSDAYGRKVTFLACLGFLMLFTVCNGASINYTTFLLTRFAMGVFNGGCMVTVPVLLIELIGEKWRMLAIIFPAFLKPFGIYFLIILIYIVSSWKYLSIVVGSSMIVLVFYVWCVPESPCWLTTQERLNSADKVWATIAKFNGKTTFTINQDNRDPNDDYRDQFFSYIDLFHTNKTLRWYMLCLSFQWLAIGYIYYGFLNYISINSVLIYVINFTSEYPGIILLLLTSLIMKRQSSFTVLFITLIIGVLTGRYTKGLTKSVFILIGRTAINACLVLIMLCTCEIIPTVVRSMAVGSGIMFASCGGILSHVMRNAGSNGHLILSWILGILSGFLLCCIPETKNQKLPQFLHEVQPVKKLKFNFRKSKKSEDNNLEETPLSTKKQTNE